LGRVFLLGDGNKKKVGLDGVKFLKWKCEFHFLRCEPGFLRDGLVGWRRDRCIFFLSFFGSLITKCLQLGHNSICPDKGEFDSRINYLRKTKE
jgi:hypothetical protein